MNLQRKTLFILFAVIVASCNPARKLEKDQYLLSKNSVAVDNSSVSREDLTALIRQKPNRKIFGLFRFHLWFYNLFDKEKTARKKAEWVRKTEDKNRIRRTQGKKEISTDKLIFREKLQNIGEEPAILDTSLTEKTRRQFQIYLFGKGFFNAIVTDSTLYKKNKQANVTYYVHCNSPYHVRNISYSSQDSLIHMAVNKDLNNSLLHSGQQYDEETMGKERDRITTFLRNSGYYFFTKQYITMVDDTALGNRQLDIYTYVNRLHENAEEATGQPANPEDHHPYSIRKIYILPEYNIKETQPVARDTFFYNGYFFVEANGREQIIKDAILRAVFIRSDSLYRQNDQELTYARLLDLNVFKFIKIVYNEVPRSLPDDQYQLDAFIQLSQSPKQDYTIETEATHSGGNLGIAGSIGYRNKNTFRSAEALEIRIKAAAEALRNFNDSLTDKKLFFFNSFEFGPEVSLNIKRTFLFTWLTRDWKFLLNPKTNLLTTFNYQSRPDYNRRILNGSWGYTSLVSNVKHTAAFYLADINSVKVNLSEAFKNKLTETTDLNLLNSYSTHLTVASRATYIYSNQAFRPAKSFLFFRVNFEWAGWWVAPLINRIIHEPLSSDGRKTITHIPYAQYVKPDIDFSFHQRLNPHNTLVYHTAIGVGFEGRNSSSLPFEKSFFAGGANSMRAWLARTLGPGSYKNQINIEQSGDIRAEANIEIRSSFVKWLEGAAFADAGNIWPLHEDVARPGAQFFWKNFPNEIAVGTGVGLRFDFSFFILRIDGAVKVVDPSLDPGKRWVYSGKKFALKDITPSLAIGYPF